MREEHPPNRYAAPRAPLEHPMAPGRRRVARVRRALLVLLALAVLDKLRLIATSPSLAALVAAVVLSSIPANAFNLVRRRHWVGYMMAAGVGLLNLGHKLDPP